MLFEFDKCDVELKVKYNEMCYNANFSNKKNSRDYIYLAARNITDFLEFFECW